MSDGEDLLVSQKVMFGLLGQATPEFPICNMLVN